MKKSYNNQPLAKVVKMVGSQSELAELLNVKPPTVNQWLTGVKPVPFKRCLQIESIVGGAVTAEELLPDFDWELVRRTRFA